MVIHKTGEMLRKLIISDGIKIIIGGNPVTKEAFVQIVADPFTTNAVERNNMPSVDKLN